VAEISGEGLLIRDAAGGIRRVGAGHLLSQPGTRLLGDPGGEPAPIPDPAEGLLGRQEAEDLGELAGHMREVLTGYRRRLRRLSQAQLDTAAWQPPAPPPRPPRQPAAAPVQEQFARLRLIELLTGTHPRYLPEPLRLPVRRSRSQDYAEFTVTMPEQMAFSLHQQARALLSKAGISEPVTWEPPFDWAAGIPWPGPDPDAISTEGLHPLIRAGLPVRAIAARPRAGEPHLAAAGELRAGNRTRSTISVISVSLGGLP
jgi:hypothetical protein